MTKCHPKNVRQYLRNKIFRGWYKAASDAIDALLQGKTLPFTKQNMANCKIKRRHFLSKRCSKCGEVVSFPTCIDGLCHSWTPHFMHILVLF